MCLESVKETIKPNTLIQSGWKQFNGTRDKPTFEAYSFKGSSAVPLDKWITAETKDVWSNTSTKYAAGFHIFEDEKELNNKSNKRRVYYRNVHTRGRDRSVTVVIAREMYVPADPDEWPPKG